MSGAGAHDPYHRLAIVLAEKERQRANAAAWIASDSDSDTDADNNNSASAHGTVPPASADAIGVNQFGVSNGLYACTPIAVVAIARVLCTISDGLASEDVVQASMRNDAMWRHIVQDGANLWLSFTRVNADLPVHVECRRLLEERRSPMCNLFASAVEVVREEHGHTDAAFTQAMDSGAGAQTLDAVIGRIAPRTGVVLTATSGDPYACYDAARAGGGGGEEAPVDMSVAVVRPAAARTLWVFDSHGTEDTGTAALLCRCADSADAARTLLAVLPPRAFFQATVLRCREVKAE